MKANWIIILFAALALTATGCGKKDGKGGKSGSSKKAGKKGGKKGKKSKYEGGAVTDGGTISGTVSFAGKAEDLTVKITKDNEVCDKGAGPAGAVIVKDGKVQNAVVALQGIKKGKAWSSDNTEVDNLDCIFKPRISVGKLGGKIVAKNSDSVLHNTHLFLKKGDKNLFNIALPKKGEVQEKPLRKAGLVSIKCDAHEWMQAYIYVSAHPYVAVTDAAGKFSMSDVPAGEYTALVWHETIGKKEAKVKVDKGGSATLDVAL